MTSARLQKKFDMDKQWNQFNDQFNAGLFGVSLSDFLCEKLRD